MIQRIQSLLFFLAGGCFAGAFVASLASSDQSNDGIFSDQVYTLSDHPVLQVIAGLGILLSLFVIFLYNHRDRQIKIGYVVATLAVLLPIVAILIFINEPNLDHLKIDDNLGLYLPIGMIGFTIAAIRYVKKDNKLVESMDRLR